MIIHDKYIITACISAFHYYYSVTFKVCASTCVRICAVCLYVREYVCMFVCTCTTFYHFIERFYFVVQ